MFQRLTRIAAASAVAISVSATAPLFAGDSPSASPLDDLLNTRISSAAKYEQSVRVTPASVTVVTAEEIERYGFETLTDVLDSIRGVYTTYDRNYSYLGVRGFSRPSDYNNRILVLLNGHALTEPVFGSTPVGTDLVIDVHAIERVEFVRGPSSVLYGNGAMFGVVNIVMKGSEGAPAASADVKSGSAGLQQLAARGALTVEGTDLAVSGLFRDVAGRNLYFPEFDTAETNHGIASGLDYERSRGAVATIKKGGLNVTVHYGRRTKGIPAASYDSVFGANEYAIDRREFIDASYERRLNERLSVTSRLYWDHYDYDGRYPADQVVMDTSSGTKRGFESRVMWDPRPDTRLTFGGEVTDVTRASYHYLDSSGPSFNRPFIVVAGYAQAEVQPFASLSLTAGLRFERNSIVGHWVDPRAAVVYNPTSAATLKLLYGEAYRAPDVYALDDVEEYVLKNPQLKQETVATWEVAWEQRMSPAIATFVSLYENRTVGLIELNPIDDAGTLQYQNGPVMRSRGVEAEVQYRPSSGLWAFASMSRSTAKQRGIDITNSPETLIKAGVSTSLFARGHAGLTILHDGARFTLSEGRTDPFTIANLTGTVSLSRHLDAGLTIRNITDARYQLPVGEEFRSPAMTQDGRTFEITLRVRR